MQIYLRLYKFYRLISSVSLLTYLHQRGCFLRLPFCGDGRWRRFGREVLFKQISLVARERDREGKTFSLYVLRCTEVKKGRKETTGWKEETKQTENRMEVTKRIQRLTICKQRNVQRKFTLKEKERKTENRMNETKGLQ